MVPQSNSVEKQANQGPTLQMPGRTPRKQHWPNRLLRKEFLTSRLLSTLGREVERAHAEARSYGHCSLLQMLAFVDTSQTRRRLLTPNATARSCTSTRAYKVPSIDDDTLTHVRCRSPQSGSVCERPFEGSTTGAREPGVDLIPRYAVAGKMPVQRWP